jgi:hypothetical protein
MKWEVGFANPIEQTMRTCDYNNENCYEAKTVPVIWAWGAMQVTFKSHEEVLGGW